MARLKDKYKSEIAGAMKQKFGYENVMQIPKLEKIVINMGLGNVKDDSKKFEAAVSELALIAGQRPLITKADKLVNICIPRIRDFHGVSPKGFDGRGNYALGIKEQLIFPEIEYDKIDQIRGMDIIFVTTAKTDEEAKELLRLMGMPFSA